MFLPVWGAETRHSICGNPSKRPQGPWAPKRCGVRGSGDAGRIDVASPFARSLVTVVR
ncbi:hypothetical protein SBD_1066 [Streptomyces bottropensis ATCC 25435]|uniref:Uncharacterized protein n=1 Tax=Streptomyces bottropensis ATCC 25435 TaxID=1054862 RepID=M3F9J7_9ACTN|nr:hypothetical protein SBD_1066 [Streptomyces bottropensis ATCC 25435]